MAEKEKIDIEKLLTYFWGKHIELPKEIGISGAAEEQLKAYHVNQKKWFVDLFSPKGLSFLFPTLKKREKE